MEIAEGAAASGGRSIRDLPPSKRFKFVGSHLGSAPCLPLPAKKRAFTLPLAKKRVLPPMPETAPVPVCLPAKKRAYAPAVAEDAVKVCLPVKKRVYVPPPDAIVPACLPAKKRVHVPLSPPEDAAAPPSIPAKKRVHPPQPQPEGVAAPPSVPANKPVHPPPQPPKGAAASPSIPVKKHAQAPSPPEDAAVLVPVCLPANKRVMPPFIQPSPSPSMESDGVRVAAVKKARPQGSNKRGGATDSGVANRARDYTRAEASKVSIKHREVKEQASMKPRRASTPKESKDLQCKKPCNVVNGKQSGVQVEVLKKFEQSIDPKVAAPAREEESRKEDEEVALEREQEDVEEEDDGVLCAVCRSTDGDPLDPIVFCDGCDLMVHASCYGNPLAQSIPDGDWFCSLCFDKAQATKTSSTTSKKGRPARPCCRLCPARGGAMKRTTEGAWAHIACALLVPEVFFRDPDGRDGIDCSRVPGHRFTKECYICESSRGCALECSQPKCGRWFHVSCGLNGGLCIEYRENKGGAVVAGFCREHTKLWEKQELTGKYKIVSRGQE